MLQKINNIEFPVPLDQVTKRHCAVCAKFLRGSLANLRGSLANLDGSQGGSRLLFCNHHCYTFKFGLNIKLGHGVPRGRISGMSF